MLKIENLTVEVDNKNILKDINLTLDNKKTYVILGKNGSGKTSLLMTLMGIGKYNITKGKIFLDKTDITKTSIYERTKMGFSLLFQKPPIIEGLKLRNLIKGDEIKLKKYMAMLNIDQEFLEREVNKGLSGGETKRTELLQVLMMNPKIALLDEPDSGVDIDSIKYILSAINELKKISSILIIVTHNIGIVKKINPDNIIVINNGLVSEYGKIELLNNIYKNGLGDEIVQ